tara:strand:- start:643 stop:1371 length:729 start_codon:yes stop_codon:yes gene_type:complete
MSTQHKRKYFDGTEFVVCNDSLTFSDCSPFNFTQKGTIWEDESIKLFYSNYLKKKENLVIVDVGAQVGLYTLYAKKLTNATFYAYEPYDVELNILQKNIELNNINNVILDTKAISNIKGNAKMNICKNHPGLNTLGNNILRWNPRRTETIQKNVETDTIDNLFENICVDMIKIDTEGWEYNILQGAEKVILRDKPNIQIEWNTTNMRQCNINPKDLENYIVNTLKYSIIRYNGLEEVFLIPK